MCCVLIVCIRVVVFHWLFMIQVSRSKQLYFAAIETFLKCAQQSVCASVCIALLYLTQAHTLCCCAVYFENCLLVYLTILAAICSWIHMNEYNMCWVAYMRVFVVLCTWCAIHWTEHYQYCEKKIKQNIAVLCQVFFFEDKFESVLYLVKAKPIEQIHNQCKNCFLLKKVNFELSVAVSMVIFCLYIHYISSDKQ